ncbi:hypothetical protein WJT74_05155 [Sphingomicrobium sp. XHP0239]|uniref:hypothetical protein n=1 Tax=Sphingomicrobium maritimum TaxID=3133972 RepID=UPI0031CCB260
MLVRTIRKHQNAFGDKYTKNLRKHYEVTDEQGQRLIAQGLVEEVVAKKDDEGQV